MCADFPDPIGSFFKFVETRIGGRPRDLFGTSMDVRHALGTGRCSKTHHAGHPGAEFTGLRENFDDSGQTY